MAKFSKYLLTHLVSEWSTKYVRYKALKKLIKQIKNEQEKSDRSPSDHAKKHSSLTFDRLLTFVDEPLASFHHLNQNFGITQHDNHDEEVELLDLNNDVMHKPDHSIDQSSDLNEYKQNDIDLDDMYPPTISVTSADEPDPIEQLINGAFYLDNPTPPEKQFVDLLKQDLVEIEQFYLQQQTLLLTRATEWCNATQAYETNRSLSAATNANRLIEACRRLYQLLHRLHNYRILCYVALCKIVKKHDKTNEHNNLATELALLVDQLQAFRSTAVQNCMKRITFAYAHNFTNDNLAEARKELEPPATKPVSSVDVQRLNAVAIACFVLIVIFVAQAVVVAVSSIDLSDAFLSALPTYRVVGMLSIHSLLWTLCIFCLQRTRINYQLILELDPFSSTSVIKMATFQVGLIMSFLLIANIYLLFWVLATHETISEATASTGSFSITFSFFIVLLMVLFNPFVGLLAARRYFFGVLLTVLGTPFTKVTYQATFLANQGTSLSECLPDIAFTFCSFIQTFNISLVGGLIDDPTASADFCTDFNHHYLVWWLISVPNFWRCAQCLKRWHAGAGIRNLGNAYKYGNRLVVALFDGLYTYQIAGSSGSTANNTFFALWLTFAIVNVTYSYYWDVVQDWGLLKRKSHRKWRFLRPQLMIDQPYYYYVAMALNAVFRVISGLALSRSIFFGKYATTSLFATFLFECESLRRSLWNFFRIENEHISNVEKFRAVDLLPVPTAA